jgi:ketosteroid isomerase-like protein
MRTPRAIVLIGAAYALAGCGASPGDQVQAKLQQFAHAVAAKDAPTLCRQVLAPSLVNRLTAAGLSCHQAMETFLASVSDPTMSVSKVHVKGSTATAVVLTDARGQPAAIESVNLVNTGNGWRLTSLASPR